MMQPRLDVELMKVNGLSCWIIKDERVDRAFRVPGESLAMAHELSDVIDRHRVLELVTVILSALIHELTEEKEDILIEQELPK